MVRVRSGSAADGGGGGKCPGFVVTLTGEREGPRGHVESSGGVNRR